MDDQDKLSSLSSKLLAFLSNVRKTLKLLCSPNDYILLYRESMPCFRDESRVIAQQYFKENYRSSRLQQTILEKMRKFKLHKANFAGTSFSPKKNFASLSIFKRKDGWLFLKTNLPINRYSEIEKRWRTIFKVLWFFNNFTPDSYRTVSFSEN